MELSAMQRAFASVRRNGRGSQTAEMRSVNENGLCCELSFILSLSVFILFWPNGRAILNGL